QRQVRLRRARRGRGRDRYGRPGRRQRGDRAVREPARRAGPGGLAGPVHPRLRRRTAGLAQRRGGGHLDRPDRVGRLRRRRGHRRRPRGAAHRPAHRRVHARTAGVLRQMKITLDPYMFRRVPLTELPGLVADLGYEYIELSPREDFLPFFLHPRAEKAQIAAFSRALSSAGVQIATVLPLYRWSGPDEDERQAAVRYWKRAIQIAADLGADTMN